MRGRCWRDGERDYNEVRPHSALHGQTPASITVPPCSPASMPLRAGYAGGLRPALTQAARDGRTMDGRDRETPLDRTEKHRHDGRDVIERFEPGLHQSFPVEIRRPKSERPICDLDGKPLKNPYYFFVIQTLLDAVDVERSQVHFIRKPLHPPIVMRSGYGDYKIVLKRSIINGHHVWKGRYHLPSSSMFISDALWAVLDENRLLRGMTVHKLEEA